MEEEITLRPYELSDVDHFMGWACDPQVLQFSRIIQQRVSHDSTRQQIETYFSEVVIPHPWYRAICFKGHPIGFVSVEPYGSGIHRGRALLSYAVGRDYWGRGITTTATTMAVRVAFRELGPELVRIEAFVDLENKASQRVLHKVGFVQEGFLRKYVIVNGAPLDVFIYSFLSTDIPESPSF